MISSRYNRIIIMFTLLTFTFTNISQGMFSITFPQIMTSEGPVNPTGTSSSHLRSHSSPSSSTTTWTSASSTYTQILRTPATSTTVPTSNPIVSATSNPSPSPSHSFGYRSMELHTSLARSLVVLGLILVAMSYLAL
ncbi:hypothetical protein EAE96_005216 [Botrytis aclada]|nr:hypothetical protein EAE96_005216 [Botrytis aclada]